MIVGVPKERQEGERRVALTPDAVKRLGKAVATIRVEAGAGEAAGFRDDAFRDAGAEVTADRDAVWGSEVVLAIHPPGERDPVKPGGVVIGLFLPLGNHAAVRAMAQRKLTAFSLDLLPRITRAQPMDVLSSMSTVAGYKAVLLAAAAQVKFFPMLVTAAGTIPPARVFVLGAGVAGLQAIATARRLGAVVEAFDVRPAVKEQVESLGAKFVAVDLSDLQAEGEGGYAKEMSEEQHQRELALIAGKVPEVDVVITTALIPGRPAPVLLTEAMVKTMRPGSVIVDLAAEAGGNCELTEHGQDLERHGVRILGPANLPASMPYHASQMYARNISTFLQHHVKDGTFAPDYDDEITKGTCITRDGAIVHDRVRAAVEGGGS